MLKGKNREVNKVYLFCLKQTTLSNLCSDYPKSYDSKIFIMDHYRQLVSS